MNYAKNNWVETENTDDTDFADANNFWNLSTDKFLHSARENISNFDKSEQKSSALNKIESKLSDLLKKEPLHNNYDSINISRQSA